MRAAFSIRFDRNEFAGAFGDIGTSLPLIIGVSLAAQLDATSVFVMFGLMQILTGLRYQLPMPVQPLKAMSALVIAQQVSGSVLYGAGLAIGIVMLIMTVSGLLSWLARVVPKSVIRGIQFGLGLQLALLALRDYVPSDGVLGYWLAGFAFVLTIFLLGNRRYPAALLLIVLGFTYVFAFKMEFTVLAQGMGFNFPHLIVPQWTDITTGFFLLALPQIPLSLGNSILATRQIAADLFPERPLTVKQIGFTYSLMNLLNPFFGGLPTCHGSGGMAGHYAFGARTGGSVIIGGLLYVTMGLFFGSIFDVVIQVFPLPILGVILLFEGLFLILLMRDISDSKGDLTIVVLVGLMAVGLPFGYLIGLVSGVIMAYLVQQGKIL